MHHTWTTTLDGHPLEIEARYEPEHHVLRVLIDRFPAHREELPMPFWPFAKAVLQVSGHRLAVFLHVDGARLRFEAALDDVCLDTGRSEDELALAVGGGRYVPGRVPFSPQRYYERFPFWPRVAASCCLAGGTMAAWAALGQLDGRGFTEGSQVLMIFATTAMLSGLGWWWQDFRRTGDLFRYGDAVPAIVVAVAPVRIAVAADLALPHRPGFYPAVRVVEQPALELHGREARAGDRLVALVRYLDSQNGLHSADLQVVAAAHGTDDTPALDRIEARFAPQDWSRLTDWLARVEDPRQPGLYPLALPGSGFAERR